MENRIDKHHSHRRHRHRREINSNGSEQQPSSHEKNKLLSKHRLLMEEYKKMQEETKHRISTNKLNDSDAIARNHQFIMDEDISKAKNWEQRLAIRYYQRLFKEYALVDLSYYKLNKIGMRWRTEREVVDGKGQFACGNIHCNNNIVHELCSYEVPFKYSDLEGKSIVTLVKVRLCGLLKLFYKKVKEYEKDREDRHQERQKCQTSQSIFDYIMTILKSEEDVVSECKPVNLPSIGDNNRSEKRIQLSKSIIDIKRQRIESTPTVTKEKRIKKKKAKKLSNGHIHYSSSESEEESYDEDESVPISAMYDVLYVVTMSREEKDEKEFDANGNEVISTSNDIWKTNTEVEHTENEKMDDFINQLFM